MRKGKRCKWCYHGWTNHTDDGCRLCGKEYCGGFDKDRVVDEE